VAGVARELACYSVVGLVWPLSSICRYFKAFFLNYFFFTQKQILFWIRERIFS